MRVKGMPAVILSVALLGRGLSAAQVKTGLPYLKAASTLYGCGRHVRGLA